MARTIVACRTVKQMQHSHGKEELNDEINLQLRILASVNDFGQQQVAHLYHLKIC